MSWKRKDRMKEMQRKRDTKCKDRIEKAKIT
jgi:hypothetical protein